ncbi:MAG: nucleotidyltransferase domain-containing protein [Verrucomicrobia bacterium]|nr:nucleotidyltransferase domain-containing protein [Verrucomicrobiota bacterium]
MNESPAVTRAMEPLPAPAGVTRPDGGLRREALYDPGRPVSRIARDLEPYLQVLVREFAPERVVLFGSYAYGEPNEHSDIDLLIVKPLADTPTAEAIAIRRAWREVRRRGRPMPFDLVVESPEGHRERLAGGTGFYDEINSRGLALV